MPKIIDQKRIREKRFDIIEQLRRENWEYSDIARVLGLSRQRIEQLKKEMIKLSTFTS